MRFIQFILIFHLIKSFQAGYPVQENPHLQSKDALVLPVEPKDFVRVNRQKTRNEKGLTPLDKSSFGRNKRKIVKTKQGTETAQGNKVHQQLQESAKNAHANPEPEPDTPGLSFYLNPEDSGLNERSSQNIRKRHAAGTKFKPYSRYLSGIGGVVTPRYMQWHDYKNETFLRVEKGTYERCSLGLGSVGGVGNSDGDCLKGEVCVDPATMTPLECPPSAQQACVNCNPPGSQSICPLGCRPPDPKTCAPFPLDGVCIDAKGADADYELGGVRESSPTPMVFFGGQLAKDEPCRSYGDAINSVQKGTADFEAKIKALRTDHATGLFGTLICNWRKAHLECIPDESRKTTTPSSSPSQDQQDQFSRPKGTCKCLLALGTRPAIVKEEEGDNEIEVCYIPANRGYHSECDHTIYPPHGVIDGVNRAGRELIIQATPADKFCTPDSECRIGYKYTGRRCMCKPKTIWDQKEGTCSTGIKSEMRWGPLILLLASALYLQCTLQ